MHVGYEVKNCPEVEEQALTSWLEDSSEDRSFCSPEVYPNAAGYCWMDDTVKWERFLKKLKYLEEEPLSWEWAEWEETAKELHGDRDRGFLLEHEIEREIVREMGSEFWARGEWKLIRGD